VKRLDGRWRGGYLRPDDVLILIALQPVIQSQVRTDSGNPRLDDVERGHLGSIVRAKRHALLLISPEDNPER
jgi:hypothetical protein